MEMKVYTVEGAKNILLLSKPMVYQLLHERKLHGVRVGRHWRISSDALKNFLSGSSEGGEKKEAA